MKVSFLGYRHPILFPMERFAGVPGFVDFHACCRRYGLHELLELFQRKYVATAYSMAHILKSLTFFADAEKDPMPDMLVRLDWSEVQAFFRREALRVL